MIVRNLHPDDALPVALTIGLERVCTRLNPDQALVVEDPDGALVALAVLYDGGHGLALLEHFVVDPAHRKLMAGKTLLNGIQEWARGRGIHLVFGFSPNEKLCAWAARHGFVVSDFTTRFIGMAVRPCPTGGARPCLSQPSSPR